MGPYCTHYLLLLLQCTQTGGTKITVHCTLCAVARDRRKSQRMERESRLETYVLLLVVLSVRSSFNCVRRAPAAFEDRSAPNDCVRLCGGGVFLPSS